MNKLLLLAMLAFSASTPLVEAGTGLMSDCVMELLGVRGVCTGICMCSHVMQNMDQIKKDVMPCLMKGSEPLQVSIEFHNGSIMDEIKDLGDNTTQIIKTVIAYYPKIHNGLIADRTLICTMLSAEEKCLAPVAKAGCADLGDQILKGIMTFAKSNLGCASPKSPIMLSCVTSPEVIKEVLDDIMGMIAGSGASNCFVELPKHKFVTGMMTHIENMRDEDDLFTKIKPIIAYIKTNKESLCSLVDKAVACITSKLKGKAACPTYTIDNLNDIIDEFKNKMLGCSSNNYYDVFSCGLDIDFWKTTIETKCSLLTNESKTEIETAFAALGLLLSASGDPTKGAPIKGLCFLAGKIECIIDAVKASTNCASGLVLDTLKSLTGPFLQWLDYLPMGICDGRTKTTEITDCKCQSSTFPIGDAKTGTCPASNTRGDPRCSANPVLDKEVIKEGGGGGGGGVGHVLPSISILVTGLLLTLNMAAN